MAMCRPTLETEPLTRPAPLKTCLLSTDALAFYVGQDMLIRTLMIEEQASATPSLSLIHSLKEKREEIRALVADLSMEVFVAAGIDQSAISKAEVQVTADGKRMEIHGNVFLKPGSE